MSILAGFADSLRSLFQRCHRSARRTRAFQSESLESRLLLASVMDNGATLQIELQDGERLQIVSNGGSYDFASANSTFNDAGVTEPADFVGFSTASLTLNDLGQYSRLEISDGAAGASVEFLDSGVNAFVHDVHITLDDGAARQAILFSGTTHFGNNDLTTDTNGALVMLNGSQLEVVDGNVSLTAMNQADASAEQRGISLVGSTITTSGAGSIVLVGMAPAQVPGHSQLDGISLTDGSVIESVSSAADAGMIALRGTAGVGVDNNRGIFLDDSRVVSVNGDVAFTGIAAGGSGRNNFGIRLVGSEIVSSGRGNSAATIELSGTSQFSSLWGVGVGFSPGSTVRTVDGDVSITGVGAGGGEAGRGINFNNSILESKGTGDLAGNISLHGTAGTGGTDFGSGVVMYGATSAVRTVDGSVHITGIGAADATGNRNRGVWIALPITASGDGGLTVFGTGGSGTELGGGVYIVGANAILQTNTGSILIVGTGGQVSVARAHGVVVDAAQVSSTQGDINMTGNAGNGGHSNVGFYLTNNAVVESRGIGPGASEISLTGTGGEGTSWNMGVAIDNGSRITTIDGDLDIRGGGGDGTGERNQGIVLDGVDRIESTGTGNSAADISLTGYGGGGTQWNMGFASFVGDGAPRISSVDGNISITGVASTLVTTDWNRGTSIGTDVSATGSGRVDIYGAAARGEDKNRGVFLFASSTISTNSGSLDVTGYGAFASGRDNDGIFIDDNAVLQSQSGPIALDGHARTEGGTGVILDGTAAGGARILSQASGSIEIRSDNDIQENNTGDAFVLGPGAFVGGANSTGDIAVLSDKVELDPAGRIVTQGRIVMAPLTRGLADQSITLGGADFNLERDLNLTDQELSVLSASAYIFGTETGLSTNENSISIDSVSLDQPTTIYGGTISDAAGTDFDVPQVTLDATVSPGMSPGILKANDVVLASGSTVRLEFGGAEPGAGRDFHDQIDASGHVEIESDVSLQTVWLPWWRPAGGEELIIVRRSAGSGTFAGLPEGATLPLFFGATISYIGGDGNDISLTLPQTFKIPGQLQLDQIGTEGITIYGAVNADRLGGDVANVGDIDGDGFGDFAVGAYHVDANSVDRYTGRIYVIYGSDNLPAVIDLANPGVRMTVLTGEDIGDHISKVDSGDFNNDGYVDLLVGAEFIDGPDDQKLQAGGAYIVWGGPSLGDTIDLGQLGNAGVTIHGEDAGDRIGRGIAAIGDFNDDGFEDFVLGGHEADSFGNERSQAGQAHVIFGGDDLPATIDLATAESGVLTLFGADEDDRAGISVAGLGDINGDNIDDLVIGAYLADGDRFGDYQRGGAWILYGRSTLPAEIDLAEGGDVVIHGGDKSDRAGFSVAGLGDVNGDGINDVVIGASSAESAGNARRRAGETYVIWGGPTLPAVLSGGDLGSHGFRIFGADEEDFSGVSARIVGDLNADGYDDIAVGAWGADGLFNDLERPGETYVILGGPAQTHDIDLAAPNGADFILYGADAGDLTGWAVSGAGDVDNDGTDDLIIGARDADSAGNQRPFAGEAYVLYGSRLFQPAIPVITAPARGARREDPAVTLTWNAAAGAVSYEVWLELVGGDNNPVVNVTTTDTFLEMTDAGIGRYRFWVRANRADGRRSAWNSSTFSVTLDTAIHDLPEHANGNLRPTISWDAVNGASGYRVYISNVTQQQNAIVDAILSATSFTPDFDLTFGIHRIWVQPVGAGGFVGKWSAAEDYFVGPQLLAPLGPTLNDRPVFSWTVPAGLSVIQLYVQRGSTVVINQSDVGGDSFRPESLEDGDYRWWVRGFAGNGRGGRWSERGEFSIGGSTRILSPEGVVSSGRAQITWQPVDNATDYELYLYSDTEGRVVERLYDLTATGYQSLPLREGDYRVWVRTYVDDRPIRWSRAHSFTVAAAAPGLNAIPVAPTVPTFDTTPVFSWDGDNNAATYNLLLTNGDTVIQRAGINSELWTPPTPLDVGPWDWWVQPVSALGALGPWSARATTDTSGRAVVLPTSFSSNHPNILWNQVIGADRYVLQVNNIATGEQVIREENIRGTSFMPATPLPSGNYRIWVLAIAADGTRAPWSLKRDMEVS